MVSLNIFQKAALDIRILNLSIIVEPGVFLSFLREKYNVYNDTNLYKVIKKLYSIITSWITTKKYLTNHDRTKSFLNLCEFI